MEACREWRRRVRAARIREEEYDIVAADIAADRHDRNWHALREGDDLEPEPRLNWAQRRQQAVERVAAREAAAEMQSVKAANADAEYKAWVCRRMGPAFEEAIEDCRLRSLGIRAPPTVAAPMPETDFVIGPTGWQLHNNVAPREVIEDDQRSIASSVTSSVASTLTSAFTSIVSVAKDAWDMTKKLWWRLKGE